MGNTLTCDAACCGVQDKNSLNLDDDGGRDPKTNTSNIRHQHPSGRKNGNTALFDAKDIVPTEGKCRRRQAPRAAKARCNGGQRG
jgi:hypothetical protein